MKKNLSVFVWTEAFNCSEILPPFIQSFKKHHSFPIHVFTSKEELGRIPAIPGVYASSLPNSKVNRLLKSTHNSVITGYHKGHLGTARVWSNVIRSRTEDVLVHVDADTVFLADCITPLIKILEEDMDIVGARRPYLFRSYRKEGIDGRMLDKRPDTLNTDLIAFRRESIPNKYSPFLTRRIRGRRPIRYPVVDFFDPVVFRMIENRKRIYYFDSPDKGSQSLQNLESPIFTNRISFAAVGSGLNFFKNPEAQTSPGYRAYALASYSLFAKYLLGENVGIPPLDAPELVNRLEKLDKTSWTIIN